MESDFLHSLIMIFVNAIFFLLGVTLNSLVIVVFWQKRQLRQKVCYFMIMVLSFCDLLTVIVSHPLVEVLLMLYIKKDGKYFPNWASITLEATSIIHVMPLLALLVMNFDRFLAVSHPIYHKAKVTKRKLLLLFLILLIVNFFLVALGVHNLLYSLKVYALVFIFLLTIPMLFINFKLFKIMNKHHRPNAHTHATRKHLSSLSSTFIMLLLITLPILIYTMYTGNLGKTAHTVTITELWIRTGMTVNSTLNCLIFFWKNRFLRREAAKVLHNTRYSLL